MALTLIHLQAFTVVAKGWIESNIFIEDRYFMYEKLSHPILSKDQFLHRVLKHLLFALLVISIALGIGVFGYHFICGLEWIDSLLNASMILGGMGPVNLLEGTAAKVFASCYALFSGLVFIGISSMIVLPFAHRVIHHFHLEK